MSWLSKKAKSKKAGSSTQGCPLGNIVIMISDKSDDSGVEGAKITISGPAKKSGTTSGFGLSSFKKLPTGTYTVTVKLPKKYLKGYKTTSFAPTVSVGAGRTAELQIKASAFGDLIVKVIDDADQAIAGEITLRGPDSVSRDTIRGEKTYEHLSVGKYNVQAILNNADYLPDKPEQDIQIKPGETTEVSLQVERKNIITPKLECDLHPIVFFPKVKAQDTTPELEKEKERVAPPRALTYFTQYSRPDGDYSGTGRLQILGDCIEVFADQKCTQAIALSANNMISIDNAKLQHLSKTTIYVKGVSEGTLQVIFTLDDVADKKIRLEKYASYKVEVAEGNLVIPEIKAEYLAVPLDKKNYKLRPSSEKPLKTEAILLTLGVQQTNAKNAFSQGAYLRLMPENVSVYSDDKCTKKVDLKKPIPNALLCGDKAYGLWIKGHTKGKFEASLELQSAVKAGLVIKPPCKINMAVVDLKMQLFTIDTEEYKKINLTPDAGTMDDYYTELKNLTLPEPKEISDKDKVKKGRLLHEQVYASDGTNHHARAKLVINKFEDVDWPDDTDDYEIYINRTNFSGQLKVFDAEVKGNELPFPAGPFKVSDLKNAEKVLWVEGTKTTEKDKILCLDLCLDRPDSDIGKDPKRFADHAYFDVLKIDEVKLEYKAPTNGEPSAYDDSNHRFFINFNKEKDKGRKITIKLKLNDKLKGIKVYFMLAEHKDNRKAANWGVDLPDNFSTDGITQTWEWKNIKESLKHKDKEDRKKYFHFSETTNSKGEAEKEVTLSQFGGDKFHLCAYIEEDLHLGRYIDGHADLEKRKPVMADNPLQVWKKFWYQLIEVENIPVKGVMDAPDTYRDVKTIMAAGQVTQLSRAKADKIKPQLIYPKYMVSYAEDAIGNSINNYPNDNGDAVIAGDDNQKALFKLVKKKKAEPVAIPMINVHALWVGKDDYGAKITSSYFMDYSATGCRVRDFPITIEFDKEILNPPLQGGDLLISGAFESSTPVQNASGGWDYIDDSGSFENSDLSIAPDRDSPHKVVVALPADMQGTDPSAYIKLRIDVQGAVSFLGTSYPDGIVNAYTPNDENDYVNTINHEIGHSLNQVSVPVAADGRAQNPMHTLGIPAHPLHYEDSGPHCSYHTDKCLMYEAGPVQNSLNRYCPVCHPHVLVEPITSIKAG